MEHDSVYKLINGYIIGIPFIHEIHVHVIS